jgi:hypothetical protein
LTPRILQWWDQVLIDARHVIDLLLVDRLKWCLPLKLQKLPLEVGDRLHPLLKLNVLRLDGILELHDHVGMGVHLLTSKAELLMGEVPPMLSLSKMAVCGLQLQVHLRWLMYPTTEDGALTLKSLHHVWREGNLPGVCVQKCMLLGDNQARVVLQVEQVPHVLGQAWALNGELWVGDVTHYVVALLPQGLLLIPNRKECKQAVGGVSEVALAERCESQVCHLLDAIIKVAADDGSSERCCGVEWDLQPNLARIQAVSMKQMTTIGRGRPIVAESYESAPELLWEPRVVSACGLEEAIIAECTVGVVLHTHLKIRHENITSPKVNNMEK